METSILHNRPLFDLGSEICVSATAKEIYEAVSDLPRHSEWSTELQGGEWISGSPGAVGSIFRGENFRSDNVVEWAPLIRGIWHTKSEVLTTEPDSRFQWKIHSKTGEPQELIWTFEITPDGDECVLAQKFWMGWASPGIHDITKDMDEPEQRRFIAEWTNKMERDVQLTLQRIKKVIEG
jgi:hypothetical protein